MKNVADVKSKLFLKSTKERHFLLRSYPEPKQKSEILNLDLSLSKLQRHCSFMVHEHDTKQNLDGKGVKFACFLREQSGW